MLSRIAQSAFINRVTSEVINVFNNSQLYNENSTIDFASEQDDDGIVQISEKASENLQKLTKQYPLINAVFDLDTNNDGIITPEEIENQIHESSIANIFKKEDNTLDDAMILTLGVAGGITKEELADKLRELDKDGNGIISESEINELKNSDEYKKQQQNVEKIGNIAFNVTNIINNLWLNKQ